jgi:hypothetical protein
VPEFITEFLENLPTNRINAQSKVQNKRNKRYFSMSLQNRKEIVDLHPPVCLDIPRIHYWDYRERPVVERKKEEFYVKNVFYQSARSSMFVYAREKISPVREKKFKPIVARKYRKKTMNKTVVVQSRIENINEKIKKMHELVNDPTL